MSRGGGGYVQGRGGYVQLSRYLPGGGYNREGGGGFTRGWVYQRRASIPGDRYTREGGMDIPEGGGRYTRGGMSRGIPTPTPDMGPWLRNPWY